MFMIYRRYSVGRGYGAEREETIARAEDARCTTRDNENTFV